MFSLVLDIHSCPKIVGKSLVCRRRSALAGGGGGLGARKKGKKDMLKAGQSRGSIVCVTGVMHYKTW